MTRACGHRAAAAIIAAARGCIGTPFRSQGRVPGLGLDCIGVALVAARAAGTVVAEVPRYALGGDHDARLRMALAAAQLRPVAHGLPGDVWVFAPALRQRHLAIHSGATAAGAPLFVHAHAGLGRTVEAPADPGWLVLGAWRFDEGD